MGLDSSRGVDDARYRRRGIGKTRRHDRACGRSNRSARARRQGRHRHRDLRPGQGHRAGAGHDPVGRPRAPDRRARPRQDQAGRDHGDRARARCAAHSVHARSDAVRHFGHRSARGKPGRQTQLPLHFRPGICQAVDGGRDQPRQPAHAVGAAAGDAGTARDRRRRPPRPAETVSRLGHTESAGTGRHLSAAGSAARPLPDGDRRRLSRPRRRAQNPVRHHRLRGNTAEAGDDRRRIDGRAAAGAAAAGRRIGGRGDPAAGALGTAGGRQSRRQADRLGTEPARARR